MTGGLRAAVPFPATPEPGGQAVRGVAILGATGSIGAAALRVLERHADRFEVVALTGFENAERLREMAAAVRGDAPFVALVGGADESEWRCGATALIEAATHPRADIVLNAVVGAAGLPATLAALEHGKRVALANKESLVMGGVLVLDAASRGGGELVPVDSEHSAILQCLAGRKSADVRRLVLTASGGPFRGWPVDRVAHATVEDALRHPTWRMGRKITVDSATLANKALEVIEAHHLFGVPYDRIEVVVHPQSVVHSLVEFVDGSVLAQLGVPNMELPILYALTYPDRLLDTGIPVLDLMAASPLTFEPVDAAAFPALGIGVAAGRAGGAAPAVFNAANEEAVALFLAGKVRFPEIAALVAGALDALAGHPSASLDAVIAADAAARRWVGERVGC